MSDRPLVSVVVGAYNAQDTLGATISSVLTQTYPSWELIVVDDGSTDDTARLVEAYGDRVRLIRKPNGGVASARNAAIQEARGELIAWLDADDQLLPHYLDQAVATWTAAGGGRTIVTSEALRLTHTGLRTVLLPDPFPRREDQRRRILQSNFIGIFALYPQALHDEIGMLDDRLRHAEDYDLWLRAILAGWSVVPSSPSSAIYRWLGGSASSNTAAMVVAERHIQDKLLSGEAGPITEEERQYVLLRAQSPSPRELTAAADEAIRQKDWSTASSRLRQAAQLRPDDNRLRLRSRLASQVVTRPIVYLKLRSTDRAIGWRQRVDV